MTVKGGGLADIDPGNVIAFWVDEIGEKRWFKGTPECDAAILSHFEPVWQAARTGALDAWMEEADGALALILVLDQFPRNMFRGTAKAFASDPQALAVTRHMLATGQDLTIDMPLRQFCYMPLMHSEALADQTLCLALMQERTGERSNIFHAAAHRRTILRFGRFPHRNAALGRASTAWEQAYLASGGYVP